MPPTLLGVRPGASLMRGVMHQLDLFCVVCRAYRVRIHPQGGLHLMENAVPSGAQLRMKSPGGKAKMKTTEGAASGAGRVGAYASIKDARLRTALKAHDLLVQLIRAQSAYEENLVLNSLFTVINELDEYYEVQDG